MFSRSCSIGTLGVRFREEIGFVLGLDWLKLALNWVKLGLNWVCFFVKSSFWGEKWGKLGLFRIKRSDL